MDYKVIQYIFIVKIKCQKKKKQQTCIYLKEREFEINNIKRKHF